MMTNGDIFNPQVRNIATNLCLDTMGKDEKTVFPVGLFNCQGGASASEVGGGRGKCQ